MLFSLRIRLFLIFSLIAGGFVAMMLNIKPVLSISMWLMALILISGYLLFGTVNGALYMLNRAKAEEAEKLLAQTYKPEWLFKSHKAYYYFTKGLILLHKVNKPSKNDALYLLEGEEHLLKSLDFGLPRKHERAMAYLNLAAVAIRKKDKTKAQEYYDGVKENETDNLRLQKSLEELQAAISKLD